jgi:XRE family aerobic/anaerobic benzoate catabolism transcriptional regulator
VQLEAGKANVSLQKLAGLAAAFECSLVALLAGMGPVRDAVDRIASAALDQSPQELDHLLLALERGRKEKIALVGLRGAGKTTVGRAVAEAAQCAFVELNRRVEERAGMSLGEIFEYHGVERYRSLSLEALEAVLAQPGPCVLEVGGSLVLDRVAYEMLRDHTHVVWLAASPEEHLRRVAAQGDTRPMAGREDALGELQAILERREALYALADQRVDTESEGVAGSVELVSSVLG